MYVARAQLIVFSAETVSRAAKADVTRWPQQEVIL